MSDVYGQDFQQSVGFGIIPGYSRVAVLGNNPDIDQGTLPEDVWSVGGLYPWPTSELSLEVVSTSASDTAAGTGARTVRIVGLDANYNDLAQLVTLNGTTAVAVPLPMFRINAVFMMSAGSNGVNVGDINIRRAPGGITQAQIPAGYGISRQSMYTVRTGSTLSINSTLLALTRTGGIDKNMTIANFIQSPSGFYRMPLEISISQVTPYRHDGVPGIILPEKTDYAFRVLESSASDAAVTAAFLGVLKSNSVR